jgi:peptidoglycan/LPS O-acetylase OafA/YrhL
MDTATAARKGRLNTIEAARGGAALLVVLYHATIILSLPKYLAYFPLAGFFGFGHAGVDFFFVLSGFIIAWVHWDDIGDTRSLPVYAWRRFARIYPTYWVACALVLAAFAAGFGTMPPSAGQVASNLALVPYGAGIEPFITVAWSLQHEVLFYSIFAILIWWPVLGACLLVVWLVGILAAAAGLIQPTFPLGFVLHPNNLEFFFGMAAMLAVSRIRIPWPGVLAALGAIAFLGAGVLENVFDPLGSVHYVAWRFPYGLSAAAVLVGLARCELTQGLSVPPALVFFGSASYAVYLVHQSLMSVLTKAVIQSGMGSILTGNVIWLLLVVVSTALGIGFFLLVDKPLGQLLRGPRRVPHGAPVKPVGGGAAL